MIEWRENEKISHVSLIHLKSLLSFTLTIFLNLECINQTCLAEDPKNYKQYY